MAQITPPSSQEHSYWSYLNPLSVATVIWGSIISFFQKKEPTVVYTNDGDVTIVDMTQDLKSYRDSRASGYGKWVSVTLENGVEFNICRLFLSDIGRNADSRFFRDGELVENPPKSEAEQKKFLESLLETANKDPRVVTKWTEFWNYAGKFDLLEEITQKYGQEYGYLPVIDNRSLTQVDISLDTKKGMISCLIEGTIDQEYRLSEEETMPERVGVSPKGFKGSLAIDLNGNVVEKSIENFTFQS